MPTYQAQCAVCNTRIDFVRKVDERDDTPIHCGKKTSRTLVAPMIPAMGLADHYAIRASDGRTYYGKHEYQKYLDKRGLLPSSELAGEAEHQRAAIKKEQKEDLRKDVEQIVNTHWKED